MAGSGRIPLTSEFERRRESFPEYMAYMNNQSIPYKHKMMKPDLNMSPKRNDLRNSSMQIEDQVPLEDEVVLKSFATAEQLQSNKAPMLVQN